MRRGRAVGCSVGCRSMHFECGATGPSTPPDDAHATPAGGLGIIQTGALEDDTEEATELNVRVDTSGVGSDSPADDEPPTALVPPATLEREVHRSRMHTEPEIEAETGEETERETEAATLKPPPLTAAQKNRHEMPTAPAPFQIVKLDAAIDAAAGAGRTLEIPKSTLAQVLEPRGPKGTVKIGGAPGSTEPVPFAAGVPAPGPAPAPLSAPRLAAALADPVVARVPHLAEAHPPAKRRSRAPLVLLILVAALGGAVVTAYLLGAFRG